MELVQGSDDLVLMDVASLAVPVFCVFDQVADRQPDIGLDGREEAYLLLIHLLTPFSQGVIFQLPQGVNIA